MNKNILSFVTILTFLIFSAAFAQTYQNPITQGSYTWWYGKS